MSLPDTEANFRRSKRPLTAFAGPYGHPFHAVLVTIPIGAWVASLVFDIISAFAEHPGTFRVGAAALIAIGLVGALLAAAVGLMDLTRLAPDTRVRRIALVHMTLNLVVVAAFAIGLVLRAAAGFDGPSVGGVVLSVVGLALLGGSGFLGGEMAYRYGVRVADEDTQREGFAPVEQARARDGR